MERIEKERERSVKRRLQNQVASWQQAGIGMFALAVISNAALLGVGGTVLAQERQEVQQLRLEVQRAEVVRDQAVRELGAMAISVAQEQQARLEQAEAYTAIGAWEYVGEFAVTAYCPCQECCGRWADGITATGVPAGPGIVAVDPEVISLGATVIVDGQKYLAADTGSGVKGKHIDICMTSHESTTAFGVRTAEVWIEKEAK